VMVPRKIPTAVAAHKMHVSHEILTRALRNPV